MIGIGHGFYLSLTAIGVNLRMKTTGQPHPSARIARNALEPQREPLLGDDGRIGYTNIVC